MRSRSNRPRHRNMRQRSQVMQCKTLLVKVRGQLAVFYAALNGNRAGLRVEGNYRVHVAGGEEGVAAVGDGIKAMPGAQRLYFAVLYYQPLHF